MLYIRNTYNLAKGFIRPNLKALLAVFLMALTPTSRPLAAEEHVVSRDELRQQIHLAQQVREKQLRDVHDFLDSDTVQESLRHGCLDGDQLKNAVSLLDDDELARLADRTLDVHNDIRAGALTNEQLTYVVIALATAVVVILAT